MLHGGDGSFRDWTNDSAVAHYAEPGLGLVMPDGDDSYSDGRPSDRYGDHIIQDLIKDVETRFPVSADRKQRALVGISMGSFGAVKLALKYPDLFFLCGGLSSALDVPIRPFAMKRGQWRHHRSIFGPWNGQHQRENDRLLLARIANPVRTPYLFLTCGQQEGLLSSNRRLATILDERKFPNEFLQFRQVTIGTSGMISFRSVYEV